MTEIQDRIDAAHEDLPESLHGRRDMQNVHGKFPRTAAHNVSMVTCSSCFYVGPHQDHDLFICREYETVFVYELDGEMDLAGSLISERIRSLETFGFKQVLNRATSAIPGSSLHRAVVAYRLAKQQGLLETGPAGPPSGDDDIPY